MRRPESDYRCYARVGVVRAVAEEINSVRQQIFSRALRGFGAEAGSPDVGKIAAVHSYAGARWRSGSKRHEYAERQGSVVVTRVACYLGTVGERQTQRVAAVLKRQLLIRLIRIANLNRRCIRRTESSVLDESEAGVVSHVAGELDRYALVLGETVAALKRR